MNGRRQRGYLLVTVIITLFLVASIAVLLAYDSSNSANTSNRELDTARVEYMAHAGMQHALWRAQNNACMGNVTIPDTSLDTDTYNASISGAASGTLITLSADQDAWIRSDDVSRNNGTTASNHVKFQSGKIEQVLTRFDISSIAANSQINSAVAWFHLKAGKDHPQGPITVHEITADWTETGVTWESFTGAYRGSSIGMIPAQSTGDMWVGINLTALVQAWVNGQPNYGVLFDTTAEGIHTEYTAREDGTNPPRLEIVVGSGQASPVTAKARGKLENGLVHNLNNLVAAAYQPPSIVTLQLGTEPGVDAMLDSFYERNYGGSDYLQINADPGFTQRPVLRFGLGRVPAGARVASATLEMRMLSLSVPGTASAHELTRGFVEGTKSGGGTADGATWDTYDGTGNWTNAGGDFSTAAADETTIGSTDTWVSWNVTELVQKWVSGAPNNGLILVGGNGLDKAKFASREDADPALHPKLTISFACECGNACLAPLGSGSILVVIGSSPSSPSPWDAALRDYLQSWGYTVTLIQDDDSQGNFDAAMSANDVVFISESVASGNVGTKLTGAAIGVVNAEGQLNDELGISTDHGTPVGATLDVVDTDHYITAVFPATGLEFKQASTQLASIAGTVSPDARTLAEVSGAGGLVILDAGSQSAAGGTVSGRRVLVPIGEANVTWDHLTADGRLIVQRAIDWAMGVGATSAGNLLLVVGNAGSPVQKDIDRRDLFESWGYTVTLIDDGGGQAEFDTAAAANDVIYVTASIGGGTLADKLTGSPAPIVNEFADKLDNFGFGSSTTATVSDDAFESTDTSHYIAEPFAGSAVTHFTSNRVMPIPSGTLAPGLQTVAWATGAFIPVAALVTLDNDAERWDGQPAPARRVHLPFGDADISQVTADGLTLIKRSLEWAAGTGTGAGPFAHWKLDDASGTTALDSAGGHNGTLVNGPTWTTGSLDGGLRFDGSNDYVVVPHDDSLSFTQSITFAAWVYSTNLDMFDLVLGKGNNASTYAYYFGTEDDEIVFGFKDSSFHSFATPDLNLGTDTWHHIAATYSNVDDRIVLYHNGVEVHSATTTLDLPVNTNDLYIGSSESGADWNGVLDDIRIYDRALAADEIAELVGSLGSIAHWKLDDGTGTTAIDSEGGHDGTLANGPVWVVGQLGDALSFDGNDDYVDLTSNTELDDVFAGGATAMAWIYPTGWGENGYGRILDKSSSASSTGDGWVIRMNTDNGGIINFGQGFSSGRGWWKIPNGSINLNAWQHIAVAYDAGDTANDPVIYLHGSPVAVTRVDAPSGAIRSDAAINLRLGNFAGATSHTFDGVIDDVRLYDRMLGAAEISAIASEGGGGGGGGGGGPGSCYADDFESNGYSGSTGSIEWTSSWIEFGDDNSSSSGDERVQSESGDLALRVRDNDSGGEGVYRDVDLSGFSAATLTLEYRRHNLDTESDWVAVQVSSDGGDTWHLLGEFHGPGSDDNYQTYSHAIGTPLTATSRLRLITSPTLGGQDAVYFDNIEICGQ